MARRLNSRLKIAGKLVAETPLHVGGYGESPDTDLPLAQNGKGKWYVPGTSIAGVLRKWCRQSFRHVAIQGNEALTEDVFGFQNGDQGQASFVLIEDATIEDADKVPIEFRDGVGIHRFYGSAADKAKYDRAVLPRGSTLDFAMTVEIQAKKEGNNKATNVEEQKAESDADFENRIKKTKAVIGYLLEALTKSRVRFGAAKTRGLGRMRLESFSIKEQSFVGFEILNMLNGGGQLQTIDDLINADESVKPNSSPRLEVMIKWHPRLPVMVKAGHDGIGVDTLPLTSGVRDGKLALCLPGSSIKGVLRSHAERIMRTLLDSDSTQSKEFHEQIDLIPLVEHLFGTRSKSIGTRNTNSPNNNSEGNPQPRPGLGALTIDDCYATEAINADAWRMVEIARVDNEKSFSDWELTEKLHALSNVSFRLDHHIAIDRWTGGASEGALFSRLAPHGVKWEAICLTVDLTRIREETRLPCVALLLFVLRDLAQDRLPLGFATNRGMGEIEVEETVFIVDTSEDVLAEIAKVTLDGKSLVLPERLKGEIGKTWEEAIEHYRIQGSLKNTDGHISEKLNADELKTVKDEQSL